MNNNLHETYANLLSHYGSPRNLWPQWCAQNKTEEVRQLVALGAILGQRTSWRNAHKALANLQNVKALSLAKIASMDAKRLTSLIRVAGFYTTKVKRLQGFCTFVLDTFGNMQKMGCENVSVLRPKLLDLYGIGPETADTILLYALDKPSFVIDAYTQRFVLKHKLTALQKYYDLQKLFEEALPVDLEIYQNYHVLIIEDQKGKDYCVMGLV